ncbi:Tricarboxylate/iron carrier [Paraphysoderma sedebokerense]|nr:Tricarboxylate/iron carrier [Paraphysoderma sedebokerense]
MSNFPDLSKPRYDQSTYLGRFRHFVEVTDPRTLFASESDLEKSKTLIENYKKGVIDPNVSIEEYWKAKKLYSATFHPDTGERVFLPFRMSAFVPTNLLVIAGMLQPNPSTASLIFWQWTNQSINVAINWANANKTTSMSVSETATAYAVAVGASCSVALGLSRMAEKNMFPRALGRFIPFAAVAIAGTANVFLMRQKELRLVQNELIPSLGITITDKDGKDLGKSKTAGVQAVSQVAISRIATSFPCLTIPPLVLSRFERMSYFKARPRLLMPLNFGLIAGSLMTALPCAIALFPQNAEVDAKSLEPKFHNLRDKNGNLIEKVYYNKGL